jgi:hypothetical protein
MVRTMVATNCWALFGTRVNRLRMKWVRHLCQAAPGSRASARADRWAPGRAATQTTRGETVSIGDLLPDGLDYPRSGRPRRRTGTSRKPATTAGL